MSEIPSQNTIIDRLAAAWAGHHMLTDLTGLPAPGDLAAGYRVQAAFAAALGPVTAWKCGAPAPDGPPMGSAIPALCRLADGAIVTGLRAPCAEVEIAFTLTRDLPPRAEPYDRATLLAALGPARVALELVETRVPGFPDSDLAWQIADLQNHGRLVLGGDIPGWAADRIDAELWIDGVLRVQRVNGNSAGDIFRPLLWLVNDGPARACGLRAGDVVTTGSCTGITPVRAGQRLRGVITGQGAGAVTVTLG